MLRIPLRFALRISSISHRRRRRRVQKHGRLDSRLALENLEVRLALATLAGPFEPIEPLGSLIYETTASGTVTESVDQLALVLDGNQTLTVVVEPSSGLQPSIELIGPNGTLGSATASGSGQMAVLQTIPVATTESYTLNFGGFAGTVGTFDARLILNASVEEESYVGVSNDSLEAAQDLESTFISLGDSTEAARAAVVGELESDHVSQVVFLADFETGAQDFVVDNEPINPVFYLEGLWHLSTGRGEQPGHSANTSFYYGQNEGPDGGGSYQTGQQRPENRPSRGTLTSPAIALPDNGERQYLLDFSHVLATRLNPENVDFASLEIRSGGDWTTLQRFDRVAESSTWTTIDPVDLSAYRGQTIELRWTFDTRRGPVGRAPEGWYVDDIRIREFSADDYHSFVLSQDESATIVLSGQSAEVALLAADGSRLAAGVVQPGSNFDQVIHNFVAPTAGTYYLHVTGKLDAEYSLLVTRNADFDTSGAYGLDAAWSVSAPSVDGAQWILGSLASGQKILEESEPNDSLELAQNIDDADWNLNFDTDIGDSFTNTSETIPHLTIHGTGDGTYDLYRFTVSQAGDIGIFDIDYGSVGDSLQSGDFDSYLRLLDSNGNELNSSDDSSPSFGQGGSVNGRDSYIEHQFAVPGEYILEVGSCCIGPVDSGATYELQVSIPNRSLPSEGRFYAVALEGGATLTVETSTPAGLSGEFSNELDPMVRVYNAEGQALVVGDNSADDGRNVSLSYAVPAQAGGTHYVEVLPSDIVVNAANGEYVLAIGGGTGLQPPFAVAASDIVDNAQLRGVIPAITLDFTDALLLTSLDVEDLTINGVAGSGLTLIDGNTVSFTLPEDLGEGEYRIQIAAGALLDVQGTPIDAFELTFYVDQTPPTVISVSIPEGEKGEVGDLTYTVEFSEPMQVDNLDETDFLLTGARENRDYVPVVWSYDDTGTVLTLDYENLPEDRYLLTLFSGGGRFEDTAQPDGFDLDGDGDGLEGGDFVVSFALDAETAVFPTPLEPSGVVGSLLYRGFVRAVVQPAEDTDDFLLDLDAHQTVTVVVEPSPELQATIQLLGPDGAVASASASVPGQQVILQTVPVSSAGAYTVVVGSVAETTGLYTVNLLLNSAAEEALTNGSLETAQDLEASFISLDADSPAARGAVTGRLDPRHAGAVLFADFETGEQGFTVENQTSTQYLDGLWHLSTGRGDQPGHSASTSFYYGQGEGPDGGGTYDLGELTPSRGRLVSPMIELPDTEKLVVDFRHVLQTRGSNPTVDVLRLQVWRESQPVWRTLQRYDSSAQSTVWTLAEPVDLSAYAGETIQLRWEFNTRQGPFGEMLEGWYVDDVWVGEITVDDYYSLTLQKGDVATIALEGQGASVTLLGANGSTLAEGDGNLATNLDQVIPNFVAETTGVYYLKVSGEIGNEYNLVVTRNAQFDIEPNENLDDEAQNVIVPGSALGAVRSNIQPGLIGEYFAINNPISDFPDYDALIPNYVQLDTQVNVAPTYDTFNGLPGLYDYFAVRWTGNVFIETAGDVTFYLNSNDGSRLFIDGELLINNGGLHGMQIVQGTTFLEPGHHQLRLEYFDNTSEAGVILSYQPVGEAQQIIPPEVLTNGVSDENDTYRVVVADGDLLIIDTRLPGGGPGQPENNLQEILELYDPNGSLLVRDSNGRLTHRAMQAGTYFVRVLAENQTRGEYILSVDQDRSTMIGDVNFDGVFDTADLTQVLQAGEYEDHVAHNSNYHEGDWTGDGEFDTQDLVLVLQLGQYESGANAEAANRMRWLDANPAAALVEDSNPRPEVPRQALGGDSTVVDDVAAPAVFPLSAQERLFDELAQDRSQDDRSAGNWLLDGEILEQLATDR